MTDAPERHPEMQAAVDRAAGELARRIRANPSPADPDAAAREFVESMYGGPDHWRPVPRSQRIPDPALVRPADYQRRAAEAREALRDALHRDD